MNDYHLDPPDEVDLPLCCGDEMECGEDGVCVCLECGRKVEPVADIEPVEVPLEDWGGDEGDAGPDRCPHGREWGSCDACDYLGDLAYDAGREGRR
jgi:hypothetical protein